MGHKTIGIRNVSGEKHSNNWEKIEIEISDFIGAYESEYYKIVDKGKDTFWGFPEPLYKSTEKAEKQGVFSFILDKIKG
ncbi:MAG: hypothetical protein AB8B53_10805 [Flavobacteriales bacterium]